MDDVFLPLAEALFRAKQITGQDAPEDAVMAAADRGAIRLRSSAPEPMPQREVIRSDIAIYAGGITWVDREYRAEPDLISLSDLVAWLAPPAAMAPAAADAVENVPYGHTKSIVWGIVENEDRRCDAAGQKRIGPSDMCKIVRSRAPQLKSKSDQTIARYITEAATRINPDKSGKA